MGEEPSPYLIGQLRRFGDKGQRSIGGGNPAVLALAKLSLIERVGDPRGGRVLYRITEADRAALAASTANGRVRS